MKKPNFKRITALQKAYGFNDMQESINSGMAWKLEGSVGREAMGLIECGACMLPTTAHRDYYGNLVPSRSVLKSGTKGTFKNSQDFWEKVENGEIDLYEVD